MATIIPAPTLSAQTPLQLFQGKATASQTIATANTLTSISLPNEDFDDLSGHSNTTNNSRYVCTKAGVYSVSGFIPYNQGQATTGGTLTRAAVLLKNGAQCPGGIGWAGYSGTVLVISFGPVLINLAVNDYLELAGYSGLTNTTTYYDANIYAMLRVDFIR